MKFHEVFAQLEAGKVLVQEGEDSCLIRTATVGLSAEVMKQMTGMDSPVILESSVMRLTKEGRMVPFVLDSATMNADNWKAVDLKTGESPEDRTKHRGIIVAHPEVVQNLIAIWTRHECGDIIAMKSAEGGNMVELLLDSAMFTAPQTGNETPRYIMQYDEVLDKVEFKHDV